MPDPIAEITAQRAKNHVKWGEKSIENRPPDYSGWLPTLGEEFGEVCRALTLEDGDPVRLRAELIDLAAVAFMWIASIDRPDLGDHERGPDEADALTTPALAGDHEQPDCRCEPCPGRGNDGHGHTHCAECCFGTGLVADIDCPIHGDHEQPKPERTRAGTVVFPKHPYPGDATAALDEQPTPDDELRVTDL